MARKTSAPAPIKGSKKRRGPTRRDRSEEDPRIEQYLPAVRDRLSTNFMADDDGDFCQWLKTEPLTSPEIVARDAEQGRLGVARAKALADPRTIQPRPMKPWPKHKRKDYAEKLLEKSLRRAHGYGVHLIREILKDITGIKRVDQALLVGIVAKILPLAPGEIRELIHDGYTRRLPNFCVASTRKTRTN